MPGELREMMAYVILAALPVFWLCVPSIGAQQHAPASGDEHIDALVSALILVTYVEDGAADASVTNVDANSTQVRIVGNPIPSVRDIVNLGRRAIPLLIAHLADTRLTKAKLCSYYPRGKKECIPVPVGYICEDILLNIVAAPKIITAECGDDGFGACVENGYYFRPDAYIKKGGKVYARAEVRRVKSNWQRAYRNGYIKYQHPDWWKR